MHNKAVEIRPPAVAGSFYPGQAAALRSAVAGYLKDAPRLGKRPKALIAPHAGYQYSGPIAGTAYAQIESAKHPFKRVILIGPSHRVAFQGIALSSAKYFSTPLGDVPVDAGAADILSALSCVSVLDAAHEDEHGLEVHLPFLQETLPDFSIVPLVVSDATPADVSAVLEKLWSGEESLVVVSSDLSHYHDYQTARRMDEFTSRAIESLKPDDIEIENACGRLPIQGLLLSAKKRNLKASTIDLRNSGDTAGTRDRVVGYGAYIFI